MRDLLCGVLLIVLSATTSVAQKKSDRHDHELVGSVKSVRWEDHSFDYVDGEYIECTKPMIIITGFSIEGAKTSKVVDAGEPICGYVAPDLSKRIYDQGGNIIEYLPGYTIEHSGYRLRHIYDSNGRR